jgi:hypothetical protein
MTMYFGGALNTAAQVVPDLSVVVQPPDVHLINGQPTNIFGIVGSASWGPVNSPVVRGGYADAAALFGPVKNREHDMLTILATAVLQGANNFRCVRVTDGNDVAAFVQVLTNCIRFTSRYTGSLANGDKVTIGAGTQNTSYQVTVIRPGQPAEVFDNIGAGLSGAALWTAIADAINNGVSGGVRGPSAYIVASAGGGAAAAVNATYTLSGGADGAAPSAAVKASVTIQTDCMSLAAVAAGTSGNAKTFEIAAGTTLNTFKVIINAVETIDNIGLGLTGNALWAAIVNAVNTLPSVHVIAILGAGVAAPTNAVHTLTGGVASVGGVTETQLIGVDTSPRTGMYALSGAGCSVAALADATDTSSWAAQVAFGLSEGVYMQGAGASGESITTAATNRNSIGVDTPWFKVALGDWILWNDVVNGVQRFVSPQGFYGGQLATLGPHQSGLNKPLYGIIATQKSYANQTYSSAELQQMAMAGLDVIANPSVGGFYFSPRFGRNSSSNALLHGDNYPRNTAFIARTLNAGLGIYVGDLQSEDVQREAEATITHLLEALWAQGMIGNSQGTVPFSVQIADISINPPSRVALGYMMARVRVQYLSVIEYFICNLQAGQGVTIETVGPVAA